MSGRSGAAGDVGVVPPGRREHGRATVGVDERVRRLGDGIGVAKGDRGGWGRGGGRRADARAGGTPDGAEGPAAAPRGPWGGDAEHRLDPREVEEERGRGVRPRGSGVDGATVAIARGVRVVVLLAVRLRAHDVLGGVEHGERVGERYGETELGRRRAELLGGDPPVGRGGGEGAREHLDGSLVPPATGASGSAKRPGHLLRRLRKMYLAHLARRGRRRGRPRGGHVPSRGRPRATRRSLCPKRKRPQRLFKMTPRKPRRPDVNSAAVSSEAPRARWRRSPLFPAREAEEHPATRARSRSMRFAASAVALLAALALFTIPRALAMPFASKTPRSGEEMRIDRWIAELGLNEYGDPKDTMYAEATPCSTRARARPRTAWSTSPARTPTDRGPRRKRTTTRGRPTIRVASPATGAPNRSSRRATTASFRVATGSEVPRCTRGSRATWRRTPPPRRPAASPDLR